MASLKPKKPDAMPPSKTGTVQRLSQRFLEAASSSSLSSSSSSSSSSSPWTASNNSACSSSSSILPGRTRPLIIPPPFQFDSVNSPTSSSAKTPTTASMSSNKIPKPLPAKAPVLHPVGSHVVPSSPRLRQQSAPTIFERLNSTGQTATNTSTKENQATYAVCPSASPPTTSPPITPTTTTSVKVWSPEKTLLPISSSLSSESDSGIQPGKIVENGDSGSATTTQSSGVRPSLTASTLFAHTKQLQGGVSLSSIGSDDSFVTALSQFESAKETGSPKMVPLWKQILDAIEQEDRTELNRVLNNYDISVVLQTLLTWNYSNADGQYGHDPDVALDAKELLGPTVDHLNLIQIACFLFIEDLALDILNYVATASDTLESKKILYEFMGKLWGDGNTTLHLASFLGMADLTKRLLDLGANFNKMNDHKYKPVDCADENTTLSLFLNLTEVVRYRRIEYTSLPTSPISESGLDSSWSTFQPLGHLRSTSISVLPLSASSGSRNNTNISDIDVADKPLVRPASSIGLASSMEGHTLHNLPTSASAPRLESSERPPVVETIELDMSQVRKNDEQDDAPKSSSIAIEELSLAQPKPLLSRDTTNMTGANGDGHGGLQSLFPAVAKDQECGGSTPISISTNSSLETSNHSVIRNPLQHRPRLRSYQSTPSVRMFTESLTHVKRKTGLRKKVNFDPQALMADASRTGDMTLFKSSLSQLEDEYPEKSVEEIINYQSESRGLTALHLASSYNHLELCKLAISLGADVNAVDIEGWTPLHCAAAEGHWQVFEFLARVPDADLQAATYDGELVEDLAEGEELKQRIVQLIEQVSSEQE
ncbi:hypothetical protein BGW42_001798 [Actinomortierella wolfii]|nr:hypothetical protein BGW42_001798 [Actinomortierella wolfii]